MLDYHNMLFSCFKKQKTDFYLEIYLDKRLNERESDLANKIQINFFPVWWSFVLFCFRGWAWCQDKVAQKAQALNCYAMENDLMGWSCHDLSSNEITSPCQLT